MSTLTRRAFLIGSIAIVGGVAFGAYRLRRPLPNPLDDIDRVRDGPAVTLNPYLIIDAEGVAIITPRAEMGQGVHTTLAALVAEELDLPWQTVRTLRGHTAEAYFNAAMLEAAVPFPSWDRGVARGGSARRDRRRGEAVGAAAHRRHRPVGHAFGADPRIPVRAGGTRGRRRAQRLECALGLR